MERGLETAWVFRLTTASTRTGKLAASLWVFQPVKQAVRVKKRMSPEMTNRHGYNKRTMPSPLEIAAFLFLGVAAFFAYTGNLALLLFVLALVFSILRFSQLNSLSVSFVSAVAGVSGQAVLATYKWISVLLFICAAISATWFGAL